MHAFPSIARPRARAPHRRRGRDRRRHHHPDTAKEKPQEGEIIAVGPGRYEKNVRVPMELKVGDKVLYGKYSGTEVTIETEQYLILRESDVLAVVN